MDTTIKIIDNKFNFLGDIEKYISFFFIRNYFQAKDFQLVCSTEKADILKIGNILFIDPEKPLIIENTSFDEDKKILTVKGRDLKSILDRRITIPPAEQAHDNFNGAAEDAIKHYVFNNAVNPVDNKRKIEELVIAPSKHRGNNVSWQSRYKPLNAEISNICGTSGLGYKITLDLINKKFIFDVMEGSDLTVGTKKVMFGKEFDNLAGVISTKDCKSYKTMGYVAGQGEGVKREIIEVYSNNINGLDRREIFIDARDIEQGGNLKDRGKSKLVENAFINSTEGTILNNNFEYEKDWNLGDIVIRKIDNNFENLRVTEITEVYEKYFKIDATLGNCIPGILEDIQDDMEENS